jgi:hypothetical protein
MAQYIFVSQAFSQAAVQSSHERPLFNLDGHFLKDALSSNSQALWYSLNASKVVSYGLLYLILGFDLRFVEKTLQMYEHMSI